MQRQNEIVFLETLNLRRKWIYERILSWYLISNPIYWLITWNWRYLWSWLIAEQFKSTFLQKKVLKSLHYCTLLDQADAFIYQQVMRLKQTCTLDTVKNMKSIISSWKVTRVRVKMLFTQSLKTRVGHLVKANPNNQTDDLAWETFLSSTWCRTADVRVCARNKAPVSLHLFVCVAVAAVSVPLSQLTKGEEQIRVF